MKRLERIIFVNWYLFESRQFDLRGDVLITGPNGSGKTSLLDAIQVVALGGHGNHVQLNANAAEKGERTIKSYCLGQLSEDDGNSISSVRDSAVTHIGLVFTDDETGNSTTVGIAMTAKKSQPKHEVQGLYIVDGLRLTLDDYINATTEGDVPLSWEQLKQNIALQSGRDSATPYFFGKQPEKYIEQLCLTLAPKGRRIDSKKFVQSFRKAINLKDIVDVSDFVKFYVLEDHPLDIKRLNDSVTRYKEMLSAAEAVKKQLDSMSNVNKSFQKWQKSNANSLHYEWVEKEFRYILADAERVRLEDNLEKLKKAIEDTASEQKECMAKLDAATNLRDSLKQQLDSDGSEAQVKTLDAEINALLQSTSITRKEISNHLSILENISDLSRTDTLSEYTSSLTNMVKKLLPKNDLDVVSWPKDASAVDTEIPRIKDALQTTIKQIDDNLSLINYEYTTKGSDFKNDMARLKQLKRGGSNVNQNTLSLQKELLNQGITAKPLSELAEITDPAWQKAIEAYLGRNVDALFVNPEDTEKATKVFRTLNKKYRLYGASVINARKVQSWSAEVNKGSCASFIKAENPIVKAFLTRMLNRVMFVDTERDLLKEDIAITSDGMLHKNGTIKSLKIQSELSLGKKARKQTIENLENKIATDGKVIAELEGDLRLHKENISKLNVVFDKLSQWVSVSELQRKLKDYNSDYEEKNTQRSSISLEHLDDIKTSYKQANDKIKGLLALDKRLTISISKDETLLEGDKERLTSQEEFVKTCGEQRDSIEGNEHFDMEDAIVKHTKLSSDCSSDEKALEQAAAFREKHNKLADNHLGTAKQSLYKYCIEFKIEQPKESATSDELWHWVLSIVKELEETELAKHEGAAKHALAEAETAFRHDVAFKLRENITNMDLHIKELNRSLATRPFSGQEVYQFRYTANKEYKDILKFIESTSQSAQANVGTLFDKDREVGEKLMELIRSDEDKVADYRNYYSYDIIIKNEANKSTSKLSSRIKTASGGENRTPYYVTIGASMAGAYRIADHRHSDGMGLIPLDEAFEKMDANNFYQAAMYLKDIGLQMFLAAPDDSEIKLSAVVDTVIFLTRNGNTLNSTVKYLKGDTSDLLLSDNTFIHPELSEAYVSKLNE